MEYSEKDKSPKKFFYNLIFAAVVLKILFFVYTFLLSIEMMGKAFSGFGSGFSDFFMLATSNPLSGLIIGLVTTSIVQSSSMTTSIVVAMVGAGTINLNNAIPIIMGANIGTSITNTIVSFAYLGKKTEFERSFGASIVHDFFNVYSVLLLFPLQITTNFLGKFALVFTKAFENIGGFTFSSPLHYIISPVSSLLLNFIKNPVIILIFALLMLFLSLGQIVNNMKGLIMQKVEKMLNQYFFKNMVISFLFGMVLTGTIQSSSIATSIIIPLVGAGLLTIEQIYPYSLGANIGTTITAILAALSVGVEAAMAIAFAHLIFNVIGTCVFMPLKKLPISSAKFIAKFSAKSKKNFIIFITIYLALHTVLIIFVIL